MSLSILFSWQLYKKSINVSVQRQMLASNVTANRRSLRCLDRYLLFQNVNMKSNLSFHVKENHFLSTVNEMKHYCVCMCDCVVVCGRTAAICVSLLPSHISDQRVLPLWQAVFQTLYHSALPHRNIICSQTFPRLKSYTGTLSFLATSQFIIVLTKTTRS